jgi:hypothetical protein
MDEELYNAILSGMDPTRSQAMAKRLRNQNLMGDMSALSFDPNVAQYGAGMGERAMATGTGLGKARAELVEAGAGRAQRDKELASDQAFTAEQNRLNRALDRELGYLRNDNVGGLTNKDFARYGRDLARDREKAGLGEFNKGVEQVDAALAKYEGQDLPGVGQLGRYSIGSEAREFRGILQPIENILLKARSGAAVTESEYERLRKELLGEGAFANDADFRRAWSFLKDRMAAKEIEIEAGYDPEVVDEYRRRVQGGKRDGGGTANRNFETEYGLEE